MDKKINNSNNDIPSKLKNVNLDRQFFNLNTRGPCKTQNNLLNENIRNTQNNPNYLDRNVFNEHNLQIERKNDKITDMRFADYQIINKDLRTTDRINSYLINKEKKQTSQFDRLIHNKHILGNNLIPEDTTNKNSTFFKKNKIIKKNLNKFDPNIDYSKFLN